MVNQEELNLSSAKTTKPFIIELPADKSKVFFAGSWLFLHLVVLSFTIFKIAS